MVGSSTKSATTAPSRPPGEREPPRTRLDADGVRPGGSDLVGRERELATLRERIAAAAAGAGGVVAIGGEPGIGKTVLARAVAGMVAAIGAPALWGRCHEGEWAPPYGPWVEILDTIAAGETPDRLADGSAELGTGAAALAALVPTLGAVLPAAESPAPLSPAEERFRLREAAARFLLATLTGRLPGSAGGGLPALLLLDDLHWADQPSLALLTHLARMLADAPLLVVATYRDGALDRDHPLTEALAALRREPGFVAIALRGLEPEAVTELIARGARREIGIEWGRAVHSETNGNPFYVREVTRHLLDEGRFDDPATADDGRAIPELGVPEGVRHVVGRRLGRLSAATRAVLEGASLFTSGVDFSVLRALTALDEDALLDALDEAIGAQFLRPVDDRGETYDFSHAIVRQALVAERGRNPSRAARLHRRAAEALATVHGERAAFVGELAIQYRASAALPGAERGVPHAVAAAEQARIAYAFEQALFFLRIARDLADGIDLGERGRILCQLATAEAEALALRAAEATAHEAVAALRRGETAPAEIAEFLAGLAAALKMNGAEDDLWRPLVEQGLSLIGEAHGLTWARLMLLRDPVDAINRPRIRAGRWLGFDAEAVAVARRLGDEEDAARAIDSFDARGRQETEALIASARRRLRPRAMLWELTVAANDLQYRHGAFREAGAVWREIETAAERFGAVSWQAQAAGQLTLLHLAGGDFAAAIEAEKVATRMLARLGPWGGAAGEPDALRAERATTFAAYLEGDWQEVARLWSRVLATTGGGNAVTTLAGPLFGAMSALVLARTEQPESALPVVDDLIAILAELDPRGSNQGQNGATALIGEVVWRLRAIDRAPAIARLTRSVVEAGIGDYPQTSNDLTLARMAVLDGDQGQGARHFGRARETVEAAGQRPLRSIVDHDEATALLQGGPEERARAAGLLTEALAGFESLGMAGWAERTRALIDEAASDAGRRADPAGLSERERDVLRLVARGFSDRQIAAELFISPRTVNAHVRNILLKTERANRTELSVWALEQGLLGSAD